MHTYTYVYTLTYKYIQHIYVPAIICVVERTTAAVVGATVGTAVGTAVGTGFDSRIKLRTTGS